MSVYVNEVRPNVGAPPIANASPAADGAPDYGELTNAQLAALCRERGAEPPRKANKAQLLSILEGLA